MNSYRKLAIITGVLFIIGTVAGIINVVLSSSIINSADYLTKMAANLNRITVAALLMVVMGAACAGIAISMFPVLKKYNPALAIGSVGFRLIECMFDMLIFIILLSLTTLSQEFVKAGMVNPQYFQASGILLMAGHRWTAIAMSFSFCIGAFMYYYLFYQTKLIPRWLSGWGFIGILMSLTANALDLFNIVNAFSPFNLVLNFPIALQEMVLAGWLIGKGYNPNVLAVNSK